MSSFLPRKYNNPVVIGLVAVAVVSVVVICVLMYNRSPGVASDQPAEEFQVPPLVQADPSHETQLGGGKPALVLYYGEWCGHSRNILPTWAKVKTILSENFDVLAFDDVKDAEEVAKGSKLLGFAGFPDVRFFPGGYNGGGGDAVAYTGDRSEDSLVKFAYTGGKQM